MSVDKKHIACFVHAFESHKRCFFYSWDNYWCSYLEKFIVFNVQEGASLQNFFRIPHMYTNKPQLRLDKYMKCTPSLACWPPPPLCIIPLYSFIHGAGTTFPEDIYRFPLANVFFYFFDILFHSPIRFREHFWYTIK